VNFSDACTALVKEFEGCKLTAYPDPATGGDPWTIGYGHTGPEVRQGLTITQAEAEAHLYKNLTYFCDKVRGMLKFEPTQGELDALTSFAYNCGPQNLKNSTLLRKANEGDIAGAAAEFERWNRAAGKVMPGLTRRRAAERDLFLS
jgi:lysozyme